jgi:glycosyltransferase involved in cell wall biosynthesis
VEKILVVGQTPPPLGGQAVMIKQILDQTYDNVELIHVRMAFSKEMDEIGRIRFHKFLELISVIAQVILIRFRLRPRILYFPPAGPNLVPVVRDMVILCSVRWLFNVTIFHFEASGLSEIYPRLSVPMRFLFRRAYFSPEITIRLSELTPEDGKLLRSKREFIVPNCAVDVPRYNVHAPQAGATAPGDPINILFTGVISEEKGISVLLHALAIIRKRGCRYKAHLMGKLDSSEYEQQIRSFISMHQLNEHIVFLGVLSGEAKHAAYCNADIFCFPTFFSSEAFSVVLVEAMSYALPIVTTRWRGIPSIVVDGEGGFLVPIQNPEAVADRLEQLIYDPVLRETMGNQGRQRYEDLFTPESYQRNFQIVFSSAVDMLSEQHRQGENYCAY